MRFVISLIAILAFITPARAEHYDIFLLAGQSNMDGRGKVSDLTGELASWKKEQPDVLFAYSNSGTRGKQLASDGWIKLAPGYSVRPGKPKVEKLPGDTFGPEIGFGRTVADALHTHIAILKYVEGGTSLQKDWRVGAKDGIYAGMIPFVQKRLADLTARGDTFTLRGFVWHQGESDASLSQEEYSTLLQNLISSVRKDLQAPQLPVVIGEVYDNGKRDNIRAAEKSTAAKLPYCEFAPATGLKTQDEGTHFDAASQIELGKRMGNAMLKVLK
jgi:iduronate 2-sulfatase